MFHPESNPLAPKPTGPLKPEKELVRIWLGKEAAELMDEKGPDTGDEDLNPKKHELTEKELWKLKRPDEVTLKNIPKWEELPDQETFEREFKLDQISSREYRKGRPIEEFEVQNAAEVLPMAKVFEIGDVITRTKEKYPEHPKCLTTAEVLEAIDIAGYRPATLEELLAYGRDYWKPDANPESLTRAERELQRAQSPLIYGLNSVFSSVVDGHRDVPFLHWNGAECLLLSRSSLRMWLMAETFLVLRKASPS